jgi:hypothetical protein
VYSLSKKIWSWIIGSCFFAGTFFFLTYNKLLIIHFNSGRNYSTHTQSTEYKKAVTLYFWTPQGWHQEESHILWAKDNAQNINYLTNRWLSILDEENLHSKKVIAQTVALSATGQEAYISFDRYPFEPETSTYTKYMFIEGLLKTLRSQNIKISTIRFLVHHKPLEDYHLDFSIGWPLSGF